MHFKGNDPEKLWSRLVPDGACRIWTGSTNSDGYGNLSWRGRYVKAHRLAWELTHGTIPDALWVLHTCDRPPCCEPTHLFLGTQTDNMRDMAAKGRTGIRTGDDHHLRRRPELVKRGEGHPRATLTDAQVLEIRRLYDSGDVKTRPLATRYNVPIYRIHRIVTRRIWTHI